MPLLNWLNKDSAIKASAKSAYRLLEEIPELSYGDKSSENLLIQGDNLEALKALIPFYAGKIKCIFIDPPYNTKSAFEYYDDNLEHSQWLSLMYPRLELLRELLSDDGSIWVTIDDNEAHYLKVIMDEIYGRNCFLGSIAWEKADSPRMDAEFFSYRHDHVLAYSKQKNQVLFNKLKVTDIPIHYNKKDNDGRIYYTKPLRAMGGQGDTRQARPTLYYAIAAPDKTQVYPKKKDGVDGAWRWKEEKVKKESHRIDWVNGRNGWVPYYRIYAESNSLRPPETIWFHTDTGTNRTSKSEVNKLGLPSSSFDTPKPEKLLNRIIQIASNENDIVLDSFLGSGTTTAVAHKMNRRYIGIEIGEHAKTHCQPRLQQVVDGEQGGISKVVEWQGGGGFRFCKLGATVFDEFGVLNHEIKFPTLAAHVWYIETRLPRTVDEEGKKKRSPLIGIHNETAYYLLYNGILGDKRPNGGNVLTGKVLECLPEFEGEKVIYGETTRLGEARLKQENITFKQIPYDVKAL